VRRGRSAGVASTGVPIEISSTPDFEIILLIINGRRVSAQVFHKSYLLYSKLYS
jgi:hypothetical protein